MAQINPYIHFNDNAENNFIFYQSNFGGEFLMVARFKEMAKIDFPINENEAENIANIALPNGHSILMGSDKPSFMDKYNETRIQISITTQSREKRIENSMGFW